MKQVAQFLLTTVIAAGSCLAQGLNPLSIHITSPNVQNLTWFAANLKPYQLESSPNLINWTPLGSQVIGTGALVSVTDTSTIEKRFYRLGSVGPIRSGFDDFQLDRQDDAPSVQTPIGFNVSLFGKTTNECFVNNNGNITFDNPYRVWTPNPLQELNQYIIAPFWADVDTRLIDPPNNPSGSLPVTYSYGTEFVDGRLAFGANWINVGYYEYHADKLNSFQLVLIQRSDTGAGNFDIEFNYDRILWETGDASSGENGFGGSPSRSGISNGSNRTIELAHSGETLTQLDFHPITGLPNYTTGLIYRSRNSTIAGRYIFQVRGGIVLGALNVNAGQDQILPPATTTTTLAGTASDPGGGAVTVRWSLVEGPSNITISNPNILNPTVTIPTGETTVLRLTATSVTDPSITAADTMTINP